MKNYNIPGKLFICLFIIMIAVPAQARTDTAKYENGQTKYIITVKNDKRHGKAAWYYENGKLKEQGAYAYGVQEGLWKTYYENGKPYEEKPFVNGKLQGVFKEYYDSGEIRREIPLVLGVREGHAKWYHKNGNLQEDGSYKYGVQEGLWKTYHENGRTYEEKPFVNGKLQAVFKEFYTSGAIRREIPLVMGVREGRSKWYHENGNLSEEGDYKYGVQEGLWKTYHSNGKPYEEKPFVNGKLQGIFKEYYNSGALRREIPMVKGGRVGYAKWYHENGNLSEEGEYIAGVQEGLWKTYHSNGKPYEVKPQVKGKLHGLFQEYYPDGTIRKEIPMAKGVRQGLAKWYDDDGKLTDTAYYEKGTKVELAKSESVDPETGERITSFENPDGSRTVVKADENGKEISRDVMPPKGKGLASGSMTDPATGEVTSVFTNPDGTRTTVKSKITVDEDGTEHAISVDEDGNNIVSSIRPDGVVTATKTGKDGEMLESRFTEDGTLESIEKTTDGFVTETTRDTDGKYTIVKKDLEGNILETEERYADGSTVKVDKEGNRVEMSAVDEDGETVIIKTDSAGNEELLIADDMGETLFREEFRATPKEVGQAYYEKVMGRSDWDSLPDSAKTRFVDHEEQIKKDAEFAARRQADKVREAEDQKEMADLRAKNEVKMAAIQAKQAAAEKKVAIQHAREKRAAEVQDSLDKGKELRRLFAEARDNGDQDEMDRIVALQDAHEAASMDLLKFTPEEEVEMNAKTVLRQKISDQINREANAAALKEDLERTRNDAYKDVALEGASLLSIGAQQQLELSKSNRQEDRLLSKAKNKNIVIERMLKDPNLSAAQRDILNDMAERSDLQTEGALEKKAANNRIVAAGYLIDGAMMASGGVGNAAVAVGSKLVGKAVVAKVATKVFAKNLSKGLATKAAAKGAMKTGAKVGRSVADKLIKLAQYDVKTGASKKIVEKAVARATARKVLAKKLEQGISKEVAEVAAKKVGQSVGKKVAENVGRDIAEKGLINVAASKAVGKTVAKVAGKETGIGVEKALVKSRSVTRESAKNLAKKVTTSLTPKKTPKPIAVAHPKVKPVTTSAKSAPRLVAKAKPASAAKSVPGTVTKTANAAATKTMTEVATAATVDSGANFVGKNTIMPRGKVGGMSQMKKAYPRGMPDGKVGGILDRSILEGAAGKTVTDPRPFGMLPKVMKTIQAEVNNSGLSVRIRAANDSAIAKLRAGHPPKHVKLKSKTINDLDVKLGAPPGSQGEVGFFKPKKPKELVLPKKPKNANKLQLEKHDAQVAKLTKQNKGLQKRYDQRLKEYGDNIDDINKLVDKGLISVEDGVVIDRGLSNTRLGANGKLKYNRNGPEGGTGKGFAGDHDMWDFRHPDGRPIVTDPNAPGYSAIALRKKAELQASLDRSLAQTQHGPHKDWIPVSKRDIGIDQKIRQSHNPGGEALLEFRPNKAPRTSYEIDKNGKLTGALEQKLGKGSRKAGAKEAAETINE